MHILQLRIAKAKKKLTLDQLQDFAKEKVLDLNSLPSQKDCLALRALWRDKHLEDGLSWKDEFTGFMNGNGVFQIVHQEMVSYLAEVIQNLDDLNGNPVVEVCAGNGKLSYHLRRKGIDSVAVDNTSWPMTKESPLVENVDADFAIRKYNPKLVIASYISADTDVLLESLEHPSVKYFIHLGNARDFFGPSWFLRQLDKIGNIKVKGLDGKKISPDSGCNGSGGNILYSKE